MTVETVTYISDLNATYPAGSDAPSEGDNHIRNIKTALGNSFPNFAGAAMTATEAELNTLDGITSSTAELNILDGVTATAAELNILDGVTSTAAELNLLDGSTSTNNVASVAAILDSDKGLRVPTASPSTPTANTLYNNNIVKAWAYCASFGPGFYGTGKFNFSSISKVSTGRYRLTFTTAMADTGYIVIANQASPSTVSAYFCSVGNKTTTTFDVGIFLHDGTATDADFDVMVIGNQ